MPIALINFVMKQGANDANGWLAVRRRQSSTNTHDVCCHNFLPNSTLGNKETIDRVNNYEEAASADLEALCNHL